MCRVHEPKDVAGAGGTAEQAVAGLDGLKFRVASGKGCLDCNLAEDGFNRNGDTVLVVGWDDGPTAGSGKSFEIVGRVGHQGGVAGESEHGDVVPVIADGENVGRGSAAQGCDVLEGRGLGAASGKNIQQGEICIGVGGSVERDLGVGGFLGTDGGDERMRVEQGFGFAHALDGAAEHHLDGEVLVGLKCVLEALDVLDVGLVGTHPASNAGVEVVEVFDDEGAAGIFAVRAGEVEGEDEGVAIVVEMGTEPAGGGEGQVGAVNQIGVDGADDGAIGADDGRCGLQVQVTEDLHGEAVAAAGGDDDLDAGGLGEFEGGAVARADFAGGVEERSVEVYGDEARRHVLLE